MWVGHIQSVEGLKSKDLRFPSKEEILPLDWNVEILPWVDKLQTQDCNINSYLNVQTAPTDFGLDSSHRAVSQFI